MKLALSMYSLVSAVRAGRMDLLEFIDFAARQRVAGVELLDIFWRDAAGELPALKARLAQRQLELAVYSISNNFVHSDAAARRRQLADLQRGVDMAGELGVSLLRIFAGHSSAGIERERALAWILEGLAAGAEYAQRNGVILALENHGDLAGSSEQLRAIFQSVNSPALRLNFDTGNFLPAGQAPLQALRDLMPWVALLHLKDLGPARPGEEGHIFRDPDGRELAGTALGEGLVDFAGIIHELRAAGYAGWLSLEYEGADDPVALGVPRSLAAARELLAT